MKKIIIISSYANFIEKEKTLIDCILSVSGKGYDVMVVSHYPIPESIQKSVNYSIYDSDNTFLPYHLSPPIWHKNPNFNFWTKTNSHNLAILRNMSNGLKVASGLGYDHFYFMEFDNIFEKSDFNRLDDLMNQMCEQDKKMILFRLSHRNELGDITSYCTLVFGGRISWFLENMVLPTNVQEYEKWLGKNSFVLENIFYNKLSCHEEEFLIEPVLVQNYFDKSVMNKYSLTTVCMPCVSNVHDNLILFVYNISPGPIIVQINKQFFHLVPGGWHHRPITTDMDLTIRDADTGEVLWKKFQKLSELDKVKISEKTNIVFN